jgi:serine/threonine-protein kinase
MEFIQGRELRSYFVAGEHFETAECVRIMGELLDALEFAHEAGVIHRDVKPANVMLDAQRRVKLADFGVARVQDGAEQSQAGTMVGTPAFMSPEQISGGKIDRRTDIFSAGTILYQLLTGEQPFKGDGAWTVAKQIMQDDPPHPSSVVQSVSPAFDGIVSKALAKKPKERYASAREFAAALRGTLAPGAQAAALVAPKPKARVEPKASDTELEFWRAIQNSTDAAEFEFYLEQFPEGTYAQLARHKIAKLRSSPDAQATVRMAQEDRERQEAEEQAKRKAAEESARQEAEEQAKRNAAEEKALQEVEEQAARKAAEERARRDAEEQARRETEAKAKRDAEERALREALEKTRREAAEKAKRETEEKIRQAQALARLRQQEEAKARAKAAVDEDATVAIGDARPGAAPPPSQAERKTSYALPAIGAGVAIVAGIAAYLFLGRSQVPVPVAQIPAPPKMEAAAPQKAELSTADIDKIRKETEDRVRREYADKSAAEQAKAAKAAADKAVQDKQIALKAAAEKAAQDQQVATRIAAEKAAADRAAAERLALERAGAEKAARVAAEKAVEEKAAAAKAAEENLAAAKAAERAATAAKALPATVAASAPPATQPPRDGLAGRYTFRLMIGSGISQACSYIDVQDDIEIRAGSAQGISGKGFSNLRIQSAQDGSISATAQGIWTRAGSLDIKLAGRSNATGYAGTYEGRVTQTICTGQWTLVRRGEAAAERAAAPAKAPPPSVAAAAPAAAPREAGLAGRYSFRIMVGSGLHRACENIGFQEDIEIRASNSESISGQKFSNLQIRSVQDGAVTATMWDGSNRFGSGDVKLAGRATTTGYTGTYEWRATVAGGNANCTGQWTLVRK